MNAVKTFSRGGVHPEENKFSSRKSIREIPLPLQAIIPLGQNLGAPAKPIVKKGDIVKVGQLIGQGEAFISSNIHSPYSGFVTKIDDVLDASGYRRPAIFIQVDGDVWEETIDRSETLETEIKLNRKAIIDRIKSSGIVGLGGATFPTHVKLIIPEEKKVEALLINAVECEPYLTCDEALMLSKGEEIFVGIKILMKAVDTQRAVIGIERNKPEVIEYFDTIAKKYPEIEVQPLKVKYPQGGEKQLIKAVVNKEVPSGKLPLEVGCVVINVGSAFAVYEAVQKNKPLIDRIVTVTGKSIAEPSNFKVRFGVPTQTLIEAVGGLPHDSAKIISGGPMMGKAIASPEIPIVKGSSGVLVMKETESHRKTEQNCIRCAKCTVVCPMGLEPYLLSKVSKLEKYDMAETENILDCMECGSCVYTCPAKIPLLDYIRTGKFKVSQIIRSRN
ncbi:MAG: electron transport complex subunit RsxC [Lentimicrobiaceae bacterium]|jgi:electron transport complex protein RnfC|nr:electron transport complex subunit RsxC [Lentimicrobiaceae bacterium]